MKIQVTTPATSANLAVGFDSLALALSLYNTFTFEPSNETILIGFDPEYSDESNLVYQAYLGLQRRYTNQSKPIPVTITLRKQDIPESRGLGSSASCIVAGVLASNHIHNLHLSPSECANFAAEMEGHPDNVFACVFGSLTAVFQDNNKYFHRTFDVLDFLHFTLLIPDKAGSTKELRSALPEQVSRADAVYQLSRMIHVPEAFLNADFDRLKLLLKDRIHEPYRYPFIPDVQRVLDVKQNLDGIMLISGSGPSLLILSNHDIKDQLSPLFDTFDIVAVKRSVGTTLEVLE